MPYDPAFHLPSADSTRNPNIVYRAYKATDPAFKGGWYCVVCQEAISAQTSLLEDFSRNHLHLVSTCDTVEKSDQGKQYPWTEDEF